MAALVGDESTLDFQTVAAHERMRDDMRQLASVSAGAAPLEPTLEQLLRNYLGGPTRRVPRPVTGWRAPPQANDRIPCGAVLGRAAWRTPRGQRATLHQPTSPTSSPIRGAPP